MPQARSLAFVSASRGMVNNDRSMICRGSNNGSLGRSIGVITPFGSCACRSSRILVVTVSLVALFADNGELRPMSIMTLILRAGATRRLWCRLRDMVVITRRVLKRRARVVL